MRPPAGGFTTQWLSNSLRAAHGVRTQERSAQYGIGLIHGHALNMDLKKGVTWTGLTPSFQDFTVFMVGIAARIPRHTAALIVPSSC
jgi:hypothetical protein